MLPQHPGPPAILWLCPGTQRRAETGGDRGGPWAGAVTAANGLCRVKVKVKVWVPPSPCVSWDALFLQICFIISTNRTCFGDLS